MIRKIFEKSFWMIEVMYEIYCLVVQSIIMIFIIISSNYDCNIFVILFTIDYFLDFDNILKNYS